MSAALETSTIDALDFEGNLACEAEDHNLGKNGHVPEEYAAFYLITPCCSPNMLQCKSRADALRKCRYLSCSSRGEKHAVGDYRFIPLEPKRP